MARNVPFQRTIVDTEGNVVPGAKLRVQRAISGMPLAPIYDGPTGAQINNPADPPAGHETDGFVQVYVPAGFYTFTPLSADGTTVIGTPWQDVPMGDAAGYDAEDLQSGINLNLVGAWDGGTTYEAGEDVTHESLVFRSLVNDNLNNEPETDPPATSADWAYVAIEARVTGTSASSVATGTGTKNFVTQAGLGWVVGTRLRAISVADPGAWMEGPVTGYGGTALVINAEIINGSGTFDNWEISIAGERGADGGDPGLLYTYQDTTAEADPGSGNVRFNNADLSAATEAYVDDENRAGDDLSSRLNGVASWGVAGARATLTVTKSGTTDQATFDVTAVSNETGYTKLTIAHRGGVTALTDEDAISIQLVPYGPMGAAGSDGGGLKGLSLRSASMSNIDLSADLEAGDTAGGVTLVAGDAHGAFGQSDASENGVYVVPASGAAVRHTSFDTWDKIAGGLFPVREGDFAGSTFSNTESSGAGTIDTNDLTFVEQSGIGALFRNRIINGDFDIWQRGASFTANGYTADRWALTEGSGAACTVTRQTHTLGQTGVPGNPEFFMRFARGTAGSAASYVQQPIEYARTLSGITATVSFWAKAAAATELEVDLVQHFGTTGSPSSDVITEVASAISITTSWQKFTYAVSVPSISGKTLGSDDNDYLSIRFSRDHDDTNPTTSVDISHVSVVEGDATLVADPFDKPHIHQEISLCRRYFQRVFVGAPGYRVSLGFCATSTVFDTVYVTGLPMRTEPEFIDGGGWSVAIAGDTVAGSLTKNVASTEFVLLRLTVSSGLTAGEGGMLRDIDGSAYFDLSAEL